jgi:hypothetical protein
VVGVGGWKTGLPAPQLLRPQRGAHAYGFQLTTFHSSCRSGLELGGGVPAAPRGGGADPRGGLCRSSRAESRRERGACAGAPRGPHARRARCTIRLPQCSSTMSPLAQWCSISGSGRNHRAPARPSVRSSRQSNARWKRWGRNLRRPRSYAKRRRTATPRDISKGESQFTPHEFEHVWNSVLKENPMT